MLLGGCGGGDEESKPAPQPAPRQPSGGAAQDRLPTGTGTGGVRLVKIGEFDQPLYVTQPPGDRHDLFVVEQTGRVRVVHDGQLADEPYLDLSDQVTCCGEQGLLSIAFAPDYARSGLLYVDYTDEAGDTRVVEYRRSASDPHLADPTTAREVLHVDQPFSNHNGGLVVFGPGEAQGNRRGVHARRLLYIGLGDGGSSGSEGDPDRRGQDLSTLLGKLLRIDPRASNGDPYTVPRSNPFTGRPDARPEIYSYGLRNPWRFSFDPASGSLAIGDVGQSAFEEVDLVARGDGRGANFGWSAFEGFARFNEDQQASNPVPPVLVYGRRLGCSITGGYVVRDRRLRSLYGRYLYGDYCAGRLRSFTGDPGHRATDDRPLGLRVPSLSSFGKDDAGRIYATSLEGPVYRLVSTRP